MLIIQFQYCLILIYKNGLYHSEFKGDEYIPSLNGISRLKKFQVFSNLKKFNYSHKY